MINYLYCCAYYYFYEVIRTAFHVAAVLSLLFMIYKLVGWVLWVMSL